MPDDIRVDESRILQDPINKNHDSKNQTLRSDVWHKKAIEGQLISEKVLVHASKIAALLYYTSTVSLWLNWQTLCMQKLPCGIEKVLSRLIFDAVNS